MSSEVKKCPFCAFQSPFVTSSIRAGIRPDGFVVICDFEEGGCGASGGVRNSEDEAVDAWNQRKQREALK